LFRNQSLSLLRWNIPDKFRNRKTNSISDHGKPVLKIVPFQVKSGPESDLLTALRGTLKRYEQPFEPLSEIREVTK
jgi:antitoxin (DNA-binding transcriptional repressor) of toxin-antitoxin stability system